MRNKEKVIAILAKLFEAKPDVCRDIFNTALVNTGKLPWTQLNPIISNPERLNDINETILLLMYEALTQYETFKLKPVSDYFTELEVQEAKAVYIKTAKAKLPVKFPILAKLTDGENFLSVMSVQDIAALKSAGLIQWKEGMQREVVLTKLSDNEFVGHIKYDDERAREIGKSMIDGPFYPNSLRWHIVANECDYEVKDDCVVLKAGYVAEIDGQHRDKGSEYALIQNPDIIMQMPIVLTVGSRSMAQSIINQDEKRAPINKDVVAQYKNAAGNKIAKLVYGSDELDRVLRFTDTEQGIRVKQGFFIKSEFGAAIEKYYTARSNVEQRKIAEWLIEFFNELATLKYDDFENFRTAKTITANHEMIIHYVYWSKLLKDKNDWKECLNKIISDFNFNDRNLLKQKPEQCVKE